MKKFIILLILILLPTIACAAGDFLDIKFGTSFDKVKETLLSIYDDESLWIDDDKEYILINGYELGDNVFDATLRFDHNDNFYSFVFRSSKYSANYFEFDVTDNCKYLSSAFKKKYGKPSVSYKPNFFTASSGYVAIMNKWNNKNKDIYVGVTSHEALFYALAVVTSKKMDIAYDKFKNNLEKDATDKAAQDF